MFLGKTQQEEILKEVGSIKKIDASHILDSIEKEGILSKYITVTDLDNQCVCIKISETLYIFSHQDLKDYNANIYSFTDTEKYFTELIDLKNFSNDGLREELSPHYCSLERLQREHPAYWRLLIAESIFKNKIEKKKEEALSLLGR